MQSLVGCIARIRVHCTVTLVTGGRLCLFAAARGVLVVQDRTLCMRPWLFADCEFSLRSQVIHVS